MDVFEVFKIILGLLASFFLLYFMVYYAGVYSSMQEDTQRMMISENFRKAVDDVYVTGTSIVYDDFSRLDFDLVFDGSRDPAVLVSQTGQITIRRPLVFMPGGELVMEKETIDMGWYRFGFVEALPEMTILFTFKGADEEGRRLAKNLAGMFPDTAGRSPKIRFGFCDGGIVVRPCGGEFCEAFGIISRIDSASSMSECAIAPGMYKTASFSSSCPATGKGVCIEPPGAEGYGYATANGTSYIHKNLLDLLVLVAGSGESNIYGPVSDNLFDYVNREFAQELKVMANMAYHRAALIETKMPDSATKAECMPHYEEFSEAMEEIQRIAGEEEYYSDPSMAGRLMGWLEHAAGAYGQLVSLGCEYPVEE